MVRGKFKVITITENVYMPTSKTVVLQCEYDQSIPEDQRFFDATPSGRIEMQINNPAAVEALKLGGSFYVDFTPVG